MGSAVTKSPLERRNTVARRSQRKTIHGIKAKTLGINKQIQKFTGTDEDVTFIEISSKIENLQRELFMREKNLQPQVKNIYNDTLEILKNCLELLYEKLKENQNKQVKNHLQVEPNREDDDEDVITEEINEQQEAEELAQSTDKRHTVELKLIQIEPHPDKRLSVIKMGGVPVLPQSIMDSIHQKFLDLTTQIELIRNEIEDIEETISHFVGRKNGKHYMKIRYRLNECVKELESIHTDDDAINENIRVCTQFATSCQSFLDERSSVDGVESDDEVFVPVKKEERKENTIDKAEGFLKSTSV